MTLKYYLEILCIDENEINNYDMKMLKKQYHTMALKLHPDKSGGCTKQFQELTKAFDNVSELIINNPNKIMNEDNNYNGIMDLFIIFWKSTNKENQLNVINEMNSKFQKLKSSLINTVDKDYLIDILTFIDKYNNNYPILNEIQDIIKEKLDNIEIIILNPSLEDLMKNNIYCLEYNNNKYYIPLWHTELYYDIKDCNKELIIKCNHQLEDNMWLDEFNNLHVKHSINLKTLNINESVQVIKIYDKPIEIKINELLIKKYQKKIYYNCGISRINTIDIYSISELSNIILHIFIL